MKKIIKLTESDINRIVKRILEGETNQNKKSEPKFVKCSTLGVKSNSLCDPKTKQPVVPCSKLGIKSIGYCYVHNKKPVSSKLNEQDANKGLSTVKKYEPTAAKINAKYNEIRNAISSSLRSDEDENLRNAKMQVIKFIQQVRDNKQKVTPQQLADYASTNDSLNTVISTVINKF